MDYQPTETELKELDLLLILSDEDLYTRLAKSENMQGMPQDLVRLGKEQFKIIKDNLKSTVCGNETVRHLCQSENGKSETEIVVAIGTALNVVVPGGAYLLVATLMFRYGVNNLCTKQWNR